jgi:hypothetical protein
MSGSTKLSDLKQELAERDKKNLMELCLHLARFKTENKELMGYLLFNAHDPLAYTETYKPMIDEPFEKYIFNPYYLSKGIRKAFRQISRYAKITKSKEGECTLYLYLAEQFISRIHGRIVHKSLIILLERSLKKAALLIEKMHEDYQLDYVPQFNEILEKSLEKTSFSEYGIDLKPI